MWTTLSDAIAILNESMPKKADLVGTPPPHYHLMCDKRRPAWKDYPEELIFMFEGSASATRTANLQAATQKYARVIEIACARLNCELSNADITILKNDLH